METVGDPALQAWFERTRGPRSASGSSACARRARASRAALKRASTSGWSPTATSAGGGVEVPFFGAPAPIPVGPAFLAIETGAPLLMAGVWRTGG